MASQFKRVDVSDADPLHNSFIINHIYANGQTLTFLIKSLLRVFLKLYNKASYVPNIDG